MKKALIIDDDRNILTTLEVYLEDKGFAIAAASTGAEGLSRFEESGPDIVLLDMKLPDGDGLRVLKAIKATGRKTAVIIITAFATIDTAVKAVKMGAFDYLPKPFAPGQLDLVIDKLEMLHALESEVDRLKGIFRHGDFITRNRGVRKILSTARQVAESNAIVLITGESGTGKGLLAGLIHEWSPRAGKSFVTVDCAALQENLLESDLFGHIRGAFTGAVRDKAGKLELAADGTAFLDEVSEIPLAVQGKLLRFLQNLEFVRLGETQTRTVNARVIAATNKDLDELVHDGAFRQDLYFRLNVVELFLPPLRERREDIELLANHYLERFASINAKPVEGIDEAVLHRLQTYPWPGNVRELINTIERGVILCRKQMLGVPDLPPHITDFSPDLHAEAPLTSLAEIEKQHIQKVILHTASLDEAARVLGINPATLWRKRKQYMLD